MKMHKERLHNAGGWFVRAVGSGAALLGLAMAIPNVVLASGATIVGPATALGGQNFTISGTGWAPYDEVRVSFVQGANVTFACEPQASPTGSLRAQECLVPSTLKAGNYKLQATDNTLTANATSTTSIKPFIVLSSPAGQSLGWAGVGNTVDVSGDGFGNNIKTVTIGSTSVTPNTLTVSSGGQYGPANFVVPSTVAVGTYTVTVTDNGKNAATAGLRVFKPTITFPASAGAGSEVALSGAGWPAYDTVRVSLVDTQTSGSVCSFQANSVGAFTAEACFIPTSLSARGWTVDAVDNSSSVTANEPAFGFKMLPSIELLAGPVNESGTVVATVGAGDGLNIFGWGFGASGAIQKVTFDSTVMKFNATTETSQGSFKNLVNITVPTTASAGVHTITVTDNAAAHDAASATIEVYKATMSAVASANSGENFTVSGSGWPANDRLTLDLIKGPESLPTSAVNVCSSLATNGSGVLPPTVCTEPTSLPAGTYDYELFDASQAVIAPLEAFTMNPQIVLVGAIDGQLVTGVARGLSLGVEGSGFQSNISTATIGGQAVTLSSKSVSNGTLPFVTFTVPATLAPGTYNVVLTDTGSHAASASITVYAPTISLGGTTGPAEQIVVPSGAGYPANVTVAIEMFTGPINAPTAAANFCSVPTSSTGTLVSESCTLPSNLPAGSYTVAAFTSEFGVEGLATATYKLTPSIFLTNSSSGQPATTVAPGTSIAVEGFGYGAGANVSTATIGSTSVAFSTTASSSGFFSGADFTVPSTMKAGTYTVTVTDGPKNSGTATLTVS